MAASDFQFQGMRSSMREAGHRLTSLVSTSVKYFWGSTPLSLQVSTSEAMHAQFCAPSSWPASPYRAGSRSPISLASAVQAEGASHSERAARIGRVGARGADARRRHDFAGVEARPGLLCGSKGRRTAGLPGGALLTSRAAHRLRITDGLRGRQHRHAGGAGWKRGYRSHEGRSWLAGTKL